MEQQFSAYTTQNQLLSGLVVKDIHSGEIIFQQNEDKYFTPASNTKLFTLLASKSALGDSIPALAYAYAPDGLVIKGTGDPSFLTKNDVDSIAYHFINQVKDSIIFVQMSKQDRYGAGWAWDDYKYSYQKEINALPIYGNAMTISIDSVGKYDMHPKYMDKYISFDLDAKSFIKREESTNHTSVNMRKIPTFSKNYEVPIYQIDSLLLNLLQHTFPEKRFLSSTNSIQQWNILYHTNSDSLYKDLMLDSDNFVAEQLILLNAIPLGLSDASQQTIIKEILNGPLYQLQDNPRWVDGSGLSRYNLFTPRSMVWTLEELYHENITAEQIRLWFPSKAAEGTLPTSLQLDGLYAKTGTLSNNFNLSGYLFTKGQRTLVFSWMNNHFVKSKSTISKEMSELLLFLYENW